MGRSVYPIVATCLLVVSACSSAAPAAPDSATPSPVALPTVLATPSSAPKPTPAPSPSPAPKLLSATFTPGGTAPPEAIEVQLGTCCYPLFEPNVLAAKAGEVALFLNNPTNEEFPLNHDIRIGKVQGQAIASSPVLRNSETGLLTIDDLPAGDYVFWCSVDAHAAYGMVGTLTVTP